jgi:hypothetical protein
MISQLDEISSSKDGREHPKDRHSRVVDRSAINCVLNQFNREITLARSGMIFTLGGMFIEGFDAEKKDFHQQVREEISSMKVGRRI